MKKRNLIGLVTLLMSLGISGCFGDSGSNGKGNENKTSENGGGEGEGEYITKAEGHYQIINGKKTDLEPHVPVPSDGDKTHVPQPATCERDGKVYDQCSVCGRFIDRTVKALGHDLSVDVGSGVATCEEAAYTEKKCSRCDYTEKKYSGEALGHEFGAAEAVNEKVAKASCGRTGCTSGVKYVVDVATAGLTLDSGSSWKTNPSTGAFKLNGDGQSCTFTFNLPKAFKGKIYQRGYMDSYKNNYTKKLFYETDGVSNIEVTVNNSVVDMSAQSSVIFSDVLGNTDEDIQKSESDVKDVLIGEVELSTSNTISYKRVKTLNMIVSGFVFVGSDA